MSAMQERQRQAAGTEAAPATADGAAAATGRVYGKRAKAAFRLVTGVHAALYRLTGGRFGGRIRRSPVLLLTTTGRKSNQERTVALLYLADGDDLAIVASYGGGARHPAWWLNLQANPEATVRIGRRALRVRARQAGPEERARLWPKLVEMYAGYDGYQRATSREIPVIVLRPIPGPASR